MKLLAVLNELISLAETRGQRDIANLALELERELTSLLDKLAYLRAVLDDVLEHPSPSALKALTKIELDLLSRLRDSGRRCVDFEELKSRTREYSVQTLVLALRQLKRAKLIDVELDVSSDGSVRVNICRRLV